MSRLAGMRVLLVEDRPDTAEALGLFLRHCGAEVLHVITGLEALVALRAFNPHVLLSDIEMPDMDGRELIQTIRAAETGLPLPAIVLSAHADAAHRDTALQAGFNDYVVEPFDPAVVVDVVVSVTRWRSA
jgi:CheY-like chemotaxis protein